MLTREITVGEAAGRAGVSAKAVRLYEARGLLPPAPRTAAGYRTYTDDDVRLLRFIRGARTLGLSLAEIRDIIELRRGDGRPSDRLIAVLERHLDRADHTIAELQAFKHHLARVVAEARSTVSAAEPAPLCGLIASMDRHGRP